LDKIGQIEYDLDIKITEFYKLLLSISNKDITKKKDLKALGKSEYFL